MQFAPVPPIFLYTAETGLRDEDREKLASFGYLPLLVNDIYSVSVVAAVTTPGPIPTAEDQ